ncbi:protein kinase domain-containing protein [Thermomonospora echinospora]|nr:protein kinase [Thermomonospora echinospora]
MKGDEFIARLVTGYHSLSVLHRGKGAVVYHALRDGDGNPAALKVLRLDEPAVPVGAVGDEERSSTLRISEHPHIATLYDTGVTTTGRPYTAMEYCPGGSYAEVLVREGPLPVSEVVEVGRAIAGALAVAHSEGLLHRAVTPANILRAESGPVLADFPMCRIPEELAGALAGAIPYHRPPEALQGLPQSPASDVYGLASTLWTLLAGRPPFTDPDTEPDLFTYRERVRSEPAPPVPGAAATTGLQRALARALAKDPAERYASAEEFAAALATVDTRTLPAAGPPAPEPEARDLHVWSAAPEPPAESAPERPGPGWGFFDGQPDLGEPVSAWSDTVPKAPTGSLPEEPEALTGPRLSAVSDKPGTDWDFAEGDAGPAKSASAGAAASDESGADRGFPEGDAGSAKSASARGVASPPASGGPGADWGLPEGDAGPGEPASARGAASRSVPDEPEALTDSRLPVVPDAPGTDWGLSEGDAGSGESASGRGAASPSASGGPGAPADSRSAAVSGRPESGWDFAGGDASAWAGDPLEGASSGEQAVDGGWLALPNLSAAEGANAPGTVAAYGPDPDVAPKRRSGPGTPVAETGGVAEAAKEAPDAIPAPQYAVGLEQQSFDTAGPSPQYAVGLEQQSFDTAGPVPEADLPDFQVDYRTEIGPGFAPPDESGYEQIPPGHRGPRVKPASPHRRRSAYFAAAAIGLVLGLLVIIPALGGGGSEKPRPGASGSAPAPEGTLIEPRANGPHSPQQVRITDRQVAAALTWRDGSGGKASYYVVGGPTGRTPTTLAEVPVGSTRTEISGLNPGVNYCFTVVAVLSVDQVAAATPVCTKRRT